LTPFSVTPVDKHQRFDATLILLFPAASHATLCSPSARDEEAAKGCHAFCSQSPHATPVAAQRRRHLPSTITRFATRYSLPSFPTHDCRRSRRRCPLRRAFF